MHTPKAIVSVINDLVTDRRVHKTCTTLTEQGYEVILVGRVLKNSLPLDERGYKTHRMKLWFEKRGWFLYRVYHSFIFLSIKK